MIYKKLIEKINHILVKYYPIKISFNKINTLSHFNILSYDYERFLTINMNIEGIILNGEYKNYKIVKVITTETFDWNKYIILYVSLLNPSTNPCINEKLFLQKKEISIFENILRIHPDIRSFRSLAVFAESAKHG